MEIIPKPVSGILDKIESKASTIGLILGAYGELSWRGGGGLNGAIAGAQGIVTALINDPHMPDISHVIENILKDESSFKPGLLAAVAGWVIKNIDVFPQAYKIGSALQKAGTGMASTAALIELVAHAGLLHSGGASTMGTASMTPQASFNVGGPNKPHASSTNGYKNTLTYESVVA